MNAPVITPATIRGRAALDEVRSLFDQLYLIDGDLAELEGWECKSGVLLDAPFKLTYDEVLQVVQGRRDAVVKTLENKGIRIAPDPIPTPAPALETEQTA